jgi:methyl-accepting chemotaxis protein
VPFRSLRRKILFGLLATTLIFALVMVVFAQTVIRSRLAFMLQEKGVAIARKIAADCVSPVITERYFEIEMMFKDLRSVEGDFVYAYVLDEDGRELVHTFAGGVPEGLARANPVGPLQEASAKRLETDRGPVVDIGVPLLRGQAGFLHLGLSEIPINRDVNRIVLLILLFAALSLCLGGVVAFAFSRFITRPLVTLAGAAEAFGRGEVNRALVINSDDEVGELAKVFNLMVENRQRAAEEREQLISELQHALNEVKSLRGILPICSSCKKIRSDQGSWQQIESYIRDHSDAEFSHGICPECAQRLYPDLWKKIQRASAP